MPSNLILSLKNSYSKKMLNIMGKTNLCFKQSDLDFHIYQASLGAVWQLHCHVKRL